MVVPVLGFSSVIHALSHTTGKDKSALNKFNDVFVKVRLHSVTTLASNLFKWRIREKIHLQDFLVARNGFIKP